MYLAHYACVCGFWVCVGGTGLGSRRAKTNMMAIDYNLTYLQSDNWKITSLGIKEPAISY